jgi:MYXO-CTERM domain-containing protein
MNFRKVVAGAVLVQGLALLDLSAAHANVILTYTGNDFTGFSVPPPPNPYTTADKVTATITLATPLGDNLNFATVTPLAFTLSDGVQTITDAQSIFASRFAYSTNGSGQVTAWDVAAILQVSTSFASIVTENDPDPGVLVFLDAGNQLSGASAQTDNHPGTWTETNVAVPAPPLSNLAALGVLGLAFFWRRRRQILDLVRYSTQP